MIFTEMTVMEANLLAEKGQILQQGIFLKAGFQIDLQALASKTKSYNESVRLFNSKLHDYKDNSAGGSFCNRCGAVKQVPESPCNLFTPASGEGAL